MTTDRLYGVKIMLVLTMQTLIAPSAIEVILTTDSLSNRKFIATVWTNLHNLKTNFTGQNSMMQVINIYETEMLKYDKLCVLPLQHIHDQE